jgi:hypothetical protein
MAYRVVHCGTGNVGAAALRAILDQPDLELVGHFVSSPSKAGRDSGEIVGRAPTFLERGTNVVTFSGFAIAHPATAPAGVRQRVDDACRKGGSSRYFTGMDPGWATTDLAIAALAAANRVDCARVLELGFGTNELTIAAMPAMNCVPAVCAAAPGLLGPLDVRRYWTRNAPARLAQVARRA